MNKPVLLFAVLMLLSLKPAGISGIVFTNLADLPAGISAIATATDEKHIYVCGGFTNTVIYVKEVQQYDLATNTWSIWAKSRIPKRYANAVISGNYLYVFNGEIIAGALNDQMEAFSLNRDSMYYSTSNPAPVSSGGAAVYKGMIYVFGGLKNNRPPLLYSKKLYRFDPHTDTWTALADMPETKEAKGVFVNGKLYVMGGHVGMGFGSHRVDVYDVETNSWKKAPRLPVAVSAHALAVHGNKIYLVGDFHNLHYLACYDTGTGKTLELDNNMTRRRHAGAEIIHDQLYVVGGNQASSIYSALRSMQVTNLLKP